MDASVEPERRRQASALSATLRTHRAEILARWAALCRRNPRTRALTEDQLLDHLPRLLDHLAASLEIGTDAPDATSIKDSQQHALHRLDTGFDLPQLMHEYALLRRVIFALIAETSPHLMIGGIDVIGLAIDDSLSESVDYYVRVRHRTLEALDEVAQVVTAPGELDTIALQYGAAETPIHVSLRDEGDQAVISVNNQGPVLDQESLPILFDPFQKGPVGARSRGLELGLHIVYEVVKAHGGKVEAASSAEHGTTFTAWLPKPAPAAP